MSEQSIFEDPPLEACSEQERLFVLAYVDMAQEVADREKYTCV